MLDHCSILTQLLRSFGFLAVQSQLVACIAGSVLVCGYLPLSVFPTAQALAADIDCDQLRVCKVLVYSLLAQRRLLLTLLSWLFERALLLNYFGEGLMV